MSHLILSTIIENTSLQTQSNARGNILFLSFGVYSLQSYLDLCFLNINVQAHEYIYIHTIYFLIKWEKGCQH